jgi:hypothetical protein
MPFLLKKCVSFLRKKIKIQAAQHYFISLPEAAKCVLHSLSKKIAHYDINFNRFTGGRGRSHIAFSTHSLRFPPLASPVFRQSPDG